MIQSMLPGVGNHHGAEGDGDWLDTVVTLDPSAENSKWKVIAKTPFRRRALALAARGGRVFVIGGLTEETEFSRQVDVLDSRTSAWSRGPDLPKSEMNGFGASAFAIDDRVYASSMSNSLLVLSADERRWEQAAQLSEPRFFHRIILGLNGSVLMIGGANEVGGHLASLIRVNSSKP